MIEQKIPIDYQILVDHLTTAILLVDQDLKIFYMNSSCETLFDISLFRASGQMLTDILFSPIDSFNTQKVLINALEKGQAYTRREALIRVNLHDIHVDYSVSLLPEVSSHAQRTLLVELTPVEHIKKISKEENQLQQHHVTRQLIRGIAHEIKNPLGGIRGATQLLAKLLNDAQYDEFTNIIINEVDRLRNLADTMLGSRQPPSYRKINVHEPLERVRTLIYNQTKKEIEVIRDYDLSLPEIQADLDQLIQVILNISVNAVQALVEHPDFFREHQPQILLRTRIQRLLTIHGVLHRSVVRIDIEDNGPGIPENILESIFYPLVTNRANGTGLGLNIAQNIIHQHQGMIACHSTPYKTTFSLYLPWEINHDAK